MQSLGRAPTGVRMTVEFHRDSALAPHETVLARYRFSTDGEWCEGVGVAMQTRRVVRCGAGVVYHYRMSHWIGAADTARISSRSVRYRTDELEIAIDHPSERNLGLGCKR